MRTISIWLLLLLAQAASLAADGKQEKPPAPQKEKIAFILTDTKGAIFDVNPPVTLRLFRGMPFEYIGPVEKWKKPYHQVRFLNGETLYIKGHDASLQTIVVKLPPKKTQQQIYKLMMELEQKAEAAARVRGSGMKQEDKAYFKRKFLREYHAQMVQRHKLTHGAWQRIKAAGDAAGWPGAPKKEQ